MIPSPPSSLPFFFAGVLSGVFAGVFANLGVGPLPFLDGVMTPFLGVFFGVDIIVEQKGIFRRIYDQSKLRRDEILFQSTVVVVALNNPLSSPRVYFSLNEQMDLTSSSNRSHCLLSIILNRGAEKIVALGGKSNSKSIQKSTATSKTQALTKISVAYCLTGLSACVICNFKEE